MAFEGLYDRRLTQEFHQRAPVDEVMSVQDLYRERYQGFNVKHFIAGISTSMKANGAIHG